MRKQAIQEELAKSQEQLELQRSGFEEIDQLREHLKQLSEKFTAAFVTKLKSTNEELKNEIGAVGEAFIALGEQLRSR